MLLYHGSNVEVREPKILVTNRALDFGVTLTWKALDGLTFKEAIIHD